MMHPAILDGFRLAVLEQQLGVYGVYLYQEGVGEAACRFRADDRKHLFSASKTFTAMAVGIAEGEGRLKVTDRALDYFPQYRAMAALGTEAITLRDLLHMSGGHTASQFNTDPDSHALDKDWAEQYFTMPMTHPTGTHYCYDNGCTYLLARIVEAVTGEGLRSYLLPRLFTPLGIPNPQWDTCPQGHAMGAVGLHLKTRELGLLGRLLLAQGQWHDAQLIPADYIDRAVNDTVTTAGFSDAENNCGYGYQLWRNTVPGSYRADGKNGQFSIVLPQHRAVVSVTAHNEHHANDILRAVWREILPRL